MFPQGFELYDTGHVSHILLPLGCQPKATVIVAMWKPPKALPTVPCWRKIPLVCVGCLSTASGAVGMRMVESPSRPAETGHICVTVNTRGKYDACWMAPQATAIPRRCVLHGRGNPRVVPLGRDLPSRSTASALAFIRNGHGTRRWVRNAGPTLSLIHGALRTCATSGSPMRDTGASTRLEFRGSTAAAIPLAQYGRLASNPSRIGAVPRSTSTQPARRGGWR